MKRGGIGPDYIRKPVDKAAIMVVLSALERKAERYAKEAEKTISYRRGIVLAAEASGLRSAVDSLEYQLDLLEGHPTRGWS